MQHLDIQAEFNPPEVLQDIGKYSAEEFSSQNWNRLMYFKGRALCTMNRTKEAEEIAMECIKKSIVDGDYYTLVKCHVLQAITYYGTDNEDRCRPLIEMAMDYAMESADFELMICSHSAYLYFLCKNSQFESALKLEPKIMDLIKRVPPSYNTTNALGSIASLYTDISKWDSAIKFFLLALEHAQALSLYAKQLNFLNNLGSALCRVNDLIRAEKMLKQGLELAQNMGLRQQVFLFNSNLGILRIQEARHRDAIEYFDICMGILENVPNKPPMLLIDLYNNYSLCYSMLKQTDRSLSYIDQAIAIAQEHGFERDLVQIEVNKTNLLVDSGDYNEALSIVKRGVKYYKKAKDLHQLIWVYRSMSRIYHLQKEYKKSYETERKLDAITDQYIAEIQRKEVSYSVDGINAHDAVASEYSSVDYQRSSADPSHGFIGCSKASHTVVNSALLAAQHQNTSVLILGESGTGKEIIAQMIHKNSLRRKQAFVPVNVGALSPSLVESELFGHTKGAYTGADTPTKGFFLQADRGTLFLDEITDMPLPVQSKLLRALETRKVTAVGSSKEIPYDSRIISATSQDIRAQLSDSQFRLDLFHRLNTIEIIIPPLRERQEDIEPILIHYVKHYARELNKSIPFIDRSLMDLLHNYQFPGNVRELKNIVERMYILSKKTRWDAELICEINPFSFASNGSNSAADYDEEDAIVRTLIKAKGKQKDAALLLNMSEATLSRRIAKYNLQQYTRKSN